VGAVGGGVEVVGEKEETGAVNDGGNAENPKGPTVFRSLAMKQNSSVLKMLVFVTVGLAVTGFGSFFATRSLLPKFTKISRNDSLIYACVVAVVLTQIIIFVFCFWPGNTTLLKKRKWLQLER
jgi:hypothetical protein